MNNKKLNDKEKKAQQLLKKLAKKIHYHNILYHEKNKPEIIDNKFQVEGYKICSGLQEKMY